MTGVLGGTVMKRGEPHGEGMLDFSKVPSGIFGGTESDTCVRKLSETGERTTVTKKGMIHDAHVGLDVVPVFTRQREKPCTSWGLGEPLTDV